MSTLEDRVRAATRATAAEITPGSIPPLSLARRRLRREPHRWPAPGGPGSGRAHWLGLLVPAAAAAAVLALVASTFAVSRIPHDAGTGDSRGPAPASAPLSSAPSASSTAAHAALASVPQHYVALSGFTGQQQHAVVRATATGTVLASVRPPQPYGTFTWVSAAADDRTFALAAQPWRDTGNGMDSASEPTKFFLLRLDAAGHPASLTALPIPAEPPSVQVDGIALSPDATRLAVAADQVSPQVNPKIQIFTLATGLAQEWEWPGPGWIGNNKPIGSPLSWTADGRTLAFQINPANGSIEVRLLDTTGPAGSLRSSELAVEWTAGEVVGPHGVVITGSRSHPANSLFGFNTLITPDGTKIVCVTDTDSSGDGAATEFSVSTGKIVGVLGTETGRAIAGNRTSAVTAVQDVLWSNTTGSTLVVETAGGAGVLSGNQVTPIPQTAQQLTDAAW